MTTTSDALYMGVPVIALLGREHRSRAAASLLNNVGLSKIIAKDADDYVARAAELARDLDRLGAIRAGLREKMQKSPVMDGLGSRASLLSSRKTASPRSFCQAFG